MSFCVILLPRMLLCQLAQSAAKRTRRPHPRHGQGNRKRRSARVWPGQQRDAYRSHHTSKRRQDMHVSQMRAAAERSCMHAGRKAGDERVPSSSLCLSRCRLSSASALRLLRLPLPLVDSHRIVCVSEDVTRCCCSLDCRGEERRSEKERRLKANSQTGRLFQQNTPSQHANTPAGTPA